MERINTSLKIDFNILLVYEDYFIWVSIPCSYKMYTNEFSNIAASCKNLNS